MMVITIGLVLVIRRICPFLFENLLGFLTQNMTSVMGRPADPYMPFLGSLAVFIAVANIIGNVPIVLTPTRDINTTAALAIVVFFAVHYFGVKEKGGWRYLKDLATPIFLLPLEIIGQLSRSLSLTLRLFGNVISTEMIVAVVFMLVPLVVPIPLALFGMITGILQAYIFTTLAAVYIASGLD
jgi:F-type H+-transporting ATPase subunit a